MFGPAIPPTACVALGLGALLLALGGCGQDSGSDDPAEPVGTVTPSTPVEPTDPDDPALSPRENLGRRLFSDTNLSRPAGTSCATCHDPARGFAGNNGAGAAGVARGSTGTLGLRNTPTAMYASFIPSFTVTTTASGMTARGGQFHDGRADTLALQAQGPLLAAVEMNNPDAAAVVATVAASAYAGDFRSEWGTDIFTRTDDAFAAIGQSLQAFEGTTRFHPFASRYDDLLRGSDTFTAGERRGMNAFFDPAKGDCASCHTADRTSGDPAASQFSRFAYFALGVPRNAAIPDNADPTFYDLGLAGPKRTAPAGMTNAAGQFRIPTLRNVALKSAFMHNGRFTRLTDVVAFYATRDIDPDRWYPPGQMFDDLPAELRGNVTRHPPFDLHPGDAPRLTPQDVNDIVAFLGTLTDPAAAAALTANQ